MGRFGGHLVAPGGMSVGKRMTTVCPVDFYVKLPSGVYVVVWVTAPLDLD
jgi:hypothetical protein